MKNTIDGIKFREMVLNGLNNIINREKEINSMNVFPVADGDTGTNMRLTIENGYKNAAPNPHVGKYLKDLSQGMLLGARGNSGVILSQIFKGFYLALARDSIINAREMKEALIKGYVTAYAAVVEPVEGTILTVAREGIENIKSKLVRSMTISSVFSLYLSEMKKVQERTPELLPVLKEAGVLDSGAEGYITIIEGMYKALIGQKITTEQKVDLEQENTSCYFDENSEFKQGYCMEFILQLLNSKNYRKTFIFDSFVETLKLQGNSLVALKDGTLVKIHIHTFNPSTVINIARNYGEFVSFKLENMQLQHNEFIDEHKEEKVEKKLEKLPHKELGIIAVASGDGIASFLKEMGAHIVLEGGQSMNPASESFVEALEAINSDNIVIMPNNSNIFETANQAVKIAGANNVTVIPTKNVLECYYALAMDIPDAPVEERIASLKEGKEGITALSISRAIKNYSSSDFSCNEGDFIGMINDEMVVAESNLLDATKKVISKLLDEEEKSGIIIFKGQDFDDDLEDEIRDFIEDNYSLDMEFIEGGQKVYPLLIGVI